VALHRETLVYPSLEPRPESEDLLEAIAGEMETHVRGEGRDFYRIRPYEPQDSARHVDWKSSAHTGRLQVREFTQDRQRKVEIFFDRRIAPGEQEQFEALVENCAFVVWELGARGASMWLRSQRFSMDFPEEGEVYDLLKFLALVEPMVRLTAAGVEEDEEFQGGHPGIRFRTGM